jgi:hypothetical protein
MGYIIIADRKSSKISYRSYRQLSEVACMEKRGRPGKVILKLKFINVRYFFRCQMNCTELRSRAFIKVSPATTVRCCKHFQACSVVTDFSAPSSLLSAYASSAS